ncbi:MAG: insulinase family protein [Campylobacterales bacterium]|nr:insulinase family protein [Campylobacterales bacterium]
MAATIKHLSINDQEVPVIFEEDHRLPIVNVQFIFQNSGSIADGTKAGLAKFSAKLMNEGTKALGSSSFAEMLESKAIHISSMSGKETFVIEVGSLKEELDESLGYLGELLADPNFSEDTVNKIKTTTIGSLSAKQNDFDYVASNELKSIMFQNTPLANPASGTIESVNSIELDDVKDFLKEHLVTSRLIVAVGGDVEFDKLKDKLEVIIKDIPVGEAEPLKYYDVTKDSRESLLKKETEQAYIYFGSPYYISVDSKDVYKAKIAAFILGAGGFGSRLMEEIRVKRGLAYSAYARVDISKSSSSLNGYLQTKIESLDEAKKTVKDVFEQFLKYGVTDDELEQTKKFLLGSEPLRVETMSQRLSRTFQEYYRGFELGHSQKELELIKELTLEELNKFIKEHNEILNMSFAVVTAK